MADLSSFKVNLDTAQPGDRKGESPRAAFTKYNNLVDELEDVVMNSETGTAATKDVGTGQGEIPTNDDLGSAAYVDTGTGSTEVPTNDDLGSAAYVDTGTNSDQIPKNSDLGTMSTKVAGTTGSQFRTNNQNDSRFARLSGGAAANFTAMPQQGGSPIVESGSNANGSWTKWADGTMICSTAAQTVPGGSGSFSTSIVDWPAAFSTAPRMAFVTSDSTVFGTTVTAVNATDSTTTKVTISVLRSNSTGTNCIALAHGKWK